MIEFQHLSKSFGDNIVLKDVTFSARDARVTGFVGANGAGKSTTLNILSGIMMPNSGKVLCDGEPIEHHKYGSMGIFLGSRMLPTGMTGFGYMSYVCMLKNLPSSESSKWLSFFRLDNFSQTKISAYSLGMRQRLALAAAFAGDPKNIILDEPLNGLDVEGVRLVRELLLNLAREGRCVLLSSHLLSEMELVADDIAILDGGEIVSSGELQSMRSDSENTCEVVASNTDTLLSVLSARGLSFENSRQGVVVHGVELRPLAEILFSADINLTSISIAKRSIEEMYLDGTKGGQERVTD